jgi:hypothetical protein
MRLLSCPGSFCLHGISIREEQFSIADVIKTQTGRVCHDPFCALLSGFLFFLHLHYFTAIVKAAIWTDRVRKTAGPAVGAGDGVAGLQRVLRTAAVTAALRVFALRMWGHNFLLITRTHRAEARRFSGQRADYISRRQLRQVNSIFENMAHRLENRRRKRV